MSLSALSAQKGGGMCEEKHYTHYVVVYTDAALIAIGEAADIEEIDKESYLAYVKLYRMPECAERQYLYKDSLINKEAFQELSCFKIILKEKRRGE